MRVVASGLLVLAVACSSAPDAPADPAQDTRKLLMPKIPGNPNGPVNPLPPMTAVNATVEFLQLEGGCWALKVGNDYQQPLNLPAEFKQDGLAVRVLVEPAENAASICMIGPIVRIVSISRR